MDTLHKNMKNTGIIIQAHLQSSRLPGKVLRTIQGMSIIEHVMLNCYNADVDKIIVATTSDPQNEPLCLHLKSIMNRAGAGADDTKLYLYKYHGDENDVLGRYYSAAKEFGLDYIVRVTSDCPLISSDMIDRCVAVMKYTKNDVVDFMSVDGMDTQIITFEALEKVNMAAKADYQREHVLPYVYEHPDMFRILHLEKYKLSVDTEHDFERVKNIYEP
jgi:spore coat polysaccharide biosynthesis protein SpsF